MKDIAQLLNHLIRQIWGVMHVIGVLACLVLKEQAVSPSFSMLYNPLPLRQQTNWCPTNEDVPNSLLLFML